MTTAAILDGAERSTRPEQRNFQTLDGIRGLCALCVVLWHLPGINFLPSAYLAVDLFFMMSGFVLALRYERRLQAGGMGAFMVMRLIRLYPLYLLGSLIGAAVAFALLARSGAAPHAYAAWGGKLVLAAFMLPAVAPGALVFPFNVASWSLFYELILNAGLGLAGILRGRAMSGLILGFGAALFALSWIKGDLRLTGEMPFFAWSAVRAVFGFCVGIQLFRLHAAGRLPALVVPSVVVLVCVLVCLAAPGSGPVGKLLAPAIVTLAFPWIIIAAVQNQPAGLAAGVMTRLGILSFPLYAIHYPILTAVEHAVRLPGPVTSVIAALLAVALAIAASELFDKPIRRWLTAQARSLGGQRRLPQPGRSPL